MRVQQRVQQQHQLFVWASHTQLRVPGKASRREEREGGPCDKREA